MTNTIELKTIYFFVVLLLILPLFSGTYITSLVFITLMYIVLSLSYDIMGGMAGYLNFGHCTFFGVSAYAFALLFNAKVPLLLCFLIPVIITCIYAAVISYPLFRIRGVYFGLATLGLVKLIEQIFLNLRDLTGGSAGITVATGQKLYTAYYMVLILAVLSLFSNRILLKSKFGLALASIREDESVAETFGINCYRYKMQALIISSTFASLMGSIYMYYVTYIVPESVFGLDMIFAPAIMAMLGGTGILLGPVVGAVFIAILQEILWTKIAYLHMAMYGVIFAGVGFFMPGGILRSPIIRSIKNKLYVNFTRLKNYIK